MKKMMARVFLLLATSALLVLAVLALLTMPLIVIAEPVLVIEGSFVINGYELGEFAVTGEVEKQAKALMQKIEKNKPIMILVEGSANKLGNAAENDSLARKRAEEMKAFLEIRFPNARIIARSLGDSENALQTRITVTEYIQSPVVKPGLDYRLVSYLAGILATMIFAIMAFLFLRRPKGQVATVAQPQKPKKPIQTEPVQPITRAEAEVILETRWIEATDTEGIVYLVRLVKKSDNKWHTPFMTLEDGGKPLFRADFQAAKNAVRGCVKNPRYADQFANLLAAGEDIKQKCQDVNKK